MDTYSAPKLRKWYSTNLFQWISIRYLLYHRLISWSRFFTYFYWYVLYILPLKKKYSTKQTENIQVGSVASRWPFGEDRRNAGMGTQMRGLVRSGQAWTRCTAAAGHTWEAIKVQDWRGHDSCPSSKALPMGCWRQAAQRSGLCQWEMDHREHSLDSWKGLSSSVYFPSRAS